MTNADDAALDALRRLDGAHEPDVDALARMESAMLTRFDDAAGAAEVRAGGAAHVGHDHDVIELLPDDAGVDHRRRRQTTGWLLAAAAVVAVVIAGAIVVGSPTDDTEVPVTVPPTIVDGALVTDQLRAYCVEFVEPLGAAVVGMGVDTGGESLSNVLIALEQATQGLAELPEPAAARFAPVVDDLVAAVVEARRVEALRNDYLEPLQVARDSFYAALAAVPEAGDLPECARP